MATSQPGAAKAISSAGTDAAAGASVGSVVPVIGTVIGGVVGGVVGFASGIFGPKETTGLPRIPMSDSVLAGTIAAKWFQLYLGRVENDNNYWQKQIMADGPARAWANFSTSAEPSSKNVVQVAIGYTPLYGGPLVVGSWTPSSPVSPVPGPSFVQTFVAQQISGLKAGTISGAEAVQNVAGVVQASVAGASVGAQGAIANIQNPNTIYYVVGAVAFVGLLALALSKKRG